MYRLVKLHLQQPRPSVAQELQRGDECKLLAVGGWGLGVGNWEVGVQPLVIRVWSLGFGV